MTNTIDIDFLQDRRHYENACLHHAPHEPWPECPQFPNNYNKRESMIENFRDPAQRAIMALLFDDPEHLAKAVGNFYKAAAQGLVDINDDTIPRPVTGFRKKKRPVGRPRINPPKPEKEKRPVGRPRLNRPKSDNKYREVTVMPLDLFLRLRYEAEILGLTPADVVRGLLDEHLPKIKVEVVNDANDRNLDTALT